MRRHRKAVLLAILAAVLGVLYLICVSMAVGYAMEGLGSFFLTKAEERAANQRAAVWMVASVIAGVAGFTALVFCRRVRGKDVEDPPGGQAPNASKDLTEDGG